MNEARRQAYLNLIESLVTCPSEEEIEILQANLELIDDGFAQYLREWATQTLATLDSEEAYYCANFLYGLDFTFYNLRQGSRASNLDVGIACLEIGLTVVTREAYSEKWAKFQNSLGGDYQYRIRGKKAENLELAIAAFEASLKICTRDAFPFEWATCQNNLASAYHNRIRGEKAENLELAIACYAEAFSIINKHESPQTWASVQNNLATFYSERIRGEKAENIEKAIEFYQSALSVFAREDFPEYWARTQNNLGNAYLARIRGEKAENIERAITFFQASLSIYTRENFPEYWARTQNNLGNAYLARIRGEKAENIERAIASYQESLSVYTREAFPWEWAEIQNNLGNAYSNNNMGSKAENIEMSIAFYQASLSIYTREAFPEQWAINQNNLGNAYLARIRGEKAENIERAITFYQASLSIYTREAFPEQWAIVQKNLGNIYGERIYGTSTENITISINLYQNYMETKFMQGVNSQRKAEPEKAYSYLADSIEILEICRNKISSKTKKQEFAEEWNKLSQVMVEVCLEMGNKTAALEYVERSKTRNLVELFHNARSLPNQVQRQPITFVEIRNLLTENEAILEWYITPTCFTTFIVTRDSTEPDVWQSSYADLEELEKFQHEYINDIKDEEKYDNWRHQLETRLEKLSEILHIDEIIARLPENCQKLILVPFRYLHLFPLHAIPIKRHKPESQSEETGCLLELFPGGVRYTPSCQLLQLSQRLNPSSENASSSKFFAIQNPTEDLDFTDIEVEAIAKSFNPAEVLSRQQASKTGLQQQIASLQNADIAHFSCHGFFDFLSPQKSSLILAGAKIASDGVPSENKSYIRSRRAKPSISQNV